MKTAYGFSLLLIIAACGCYKIRSGDSLSKDNIAYIQGLGLLDKDEHIIQFYSNFKFKAAGNFYTDKRIAHYWLEAEKPEECDTSFAYYQNIRAIDTVYYAGATYSPYMEITRTNGSKFKVYGGGEKPELKAFFEGAMKLWGEKKGN
jgi:hypothetical protein